MMSESAVEPSLRASSDDTNQDALNVGSEVDNQPLSSAAGLLVAGDNADDCDDDDDLTVISLPDPRRGVDHAAALAWMDQNGPEMEERRRNILLRELQRVQRASFIHFVLLCLIPTSLLVIVIATVVGDNDDCFSGVTECAKEPRTFVNAFTTRCICEAIGVTTK